MSVMQIVRRANRYIIHWLISFMSQHLKMSVKSLESGLDLYEDSSVWGLLGEIPECRHHRLRPDEIGLEQKK